MGTMAASQTNITILCKWGESLEVPRRNAIRWPYIRKALSFEMDESRSSVVDLSEWISLQSVNYLFSCLESERSDVIKFGEQYLPKQDGHQYSPHHSSISILSNDDVPAMDRLKQMRLRGDHFHLWEIYEYRGLFGLYISDPKSMMDWCYDSILDHLLDHDCIVYLARHFGHIETTTTAAKTVANIYDDSNVIDLDDLKILFELMPKESVQNIRTKLARQSFLRKRNRLVQYLTLACSADTFVVIVPKLGVRFNEYFKILLSDFQKHGIQKLYDICVAMRPNPAQCWDCEVVADSSERTKLLYTEYFNAGSCYCYTSISSTLRTILDCIPICTNKQIIKWCKKACQRWDNEYLSLHCESPEPSLCIEFVDILQVVKSYDKAIGLKILDIFCRNEYNLYSVKSYPVWRLPFEQFQIVLKYFPDALPAVSTDKFFTEFDAYVFKHAKDKKHKVVEWILQNVKAYKGWK